MIKLSTEQAYQIGVKLAKEQLKTAGFWSRLYSVSPRVHNTALEKLMDYAAMLPSKRYNVSVGIGSAGGAGIGALIADDAGEGALIGGLAGAGLGAGASVLARPVGRASIRSALVNAGFSPAEIASFL